MVSRFQRDVPDERATYERRERVRQSCNHRCVEGEEQRAGPDDLWSQICWWDAQLAGSAAWKPRDDLHA